MNLVCSMKDCGVGLQVGDVVVTKLCGNKNRKTAYYNKKCYEKLFI